MPLMFLANELLFVSGDLAMHEDCCCEEDVPRHDCASCNLPIRDTAKLTLSGFSDGDCSPCSVFNGEILVPKFGTCTWRKTGTITCEGVTKSWVISGGVGGSGGSVVVQFALTIDGFDVFVWQKTLGPLSGTYDCAGSHTLTGSGAASGLYCTHDGSNATVEI